MLYGFSKLKKQKESKTKRFGGPGYISANPLPMLKVNLVSRCKFGKRSEGNVNHCSVETYSIGQVRAFLDDLFGNVGFRVVIRVSPVHFIWAQQSK